MAKANAGRILIMPRGTYDANATYEFLDLVTYNNASWLAKKTATGIEPADGEYWHKMADGVELVTNLTTEAEGRGLDASMGKVLKDLIDAVGADALRERLDALEADNVLQSDDIEALKLAVEALGNIDNATVRYVSDEADENFDWIQVQDAEGNWVNFQIAYTQRLPLHMTSANEGGWHITKNAGANNDILSMVCGETLKFSVVANSYAEVKVASNVKDFSRYEVLHVHKKMTANTTSGKCTGTINIVNGVDGSIVTTRVFHGEYTGNWEGEFSLDISNLVGEYYIEFVFFNSSPSAFIIELSNFYLD